MIADLKLWEAECRDDDGLISVVCVMFPIFVILVVELCVVVAPEFDLIKVIEVIVIDFEKLTDIPRQQEAAFQTHVAKPATGGRLGSLLGMEQIGTESCENAVGETHRKIPAKKRDRRLNCSPRGVRHVNLSCDKFIFEILRALRHRLSVSPFRRRIMSATRHLFFWIEQ